MVPYTNKPTEWPWGSPLGPLLANVFMSSLEEKLELEGKLPDYYRSYVDDTLTIMPNITTATDFLNTLNHAHPSVSFTMEIENDGVLPFSWHPAPKPCTPNRD